ncbi:MAG: 4a-hydroxytetrahydrobiopterin dehydratase [Patescibacteria group bacterium]
MRISLQNLQNIKDALLIVAVLYFYTMALVLNFGRNAYGMDSPIFFLLMSLIFLISIALEIVIVWWNKRKTIFWFVLAVFSYGVIGLYVAPILYGSWILTYIFLEPIIMVFVGGFAFSIGHLTAESIYYKTALTPARVKSEVTELPGWNYEKRQLIKTYEFADAGEAINYLNRISQISGIAEHPPEELHVENNRLTVTLSSPVASGITTTDLHLAKKIDSL